MGVSISYSGSLNEAAQLPEVVAWLHEQCEKIKWRCDDVTEEVSGVLLRRVDDTTAKPELVDVDVRGVYIHPPGCETLLFLFDPAGKLVHYFEIPSMLLTQQAQDTGQKHYMDAPNWCKTTGEPGSHLWIVLILRELKKQFMSNLEVRDDTGYWETSSLKNLVEEHEMMAGLLASFDSTAVKSVLRAAGEKIGDDVKIKKLDPKLARTPAKRAPRKGKPN